MGRHGMTPAERLWARVDKQGDDDCWPWTGGVSNGYGRLYNNGGNVLAHRVAWQVTNGPAASGTIVRQVCGNKLCCNPAHLTLETQSPYDKGRETRFAIAGLRQCIVAGTITLCDLMNDPPDCIQRLSLIDVIVMCRPSGRRAHPGLGSLGECALHDGINLLLPVERAGLRERAWVAEFDPWAKGYSDELVAA